MSDPMTYPCPVCGYLMFNEPPGSYGLCSICFWEDDHVQLGFPLMAGGANKVSLYQAQQNFLSFGACESGITRSIRKPTNSDKRDPQWRPFDPQRDPHLSWDLEADSLRWRAAGENVCLYYWRDDYWLADKPVA